MFGEMKICLLQLSALYRGIRYVTHFLRLVLGFFCNQSGIFYQVPSSITLTRQPTPGISQLCLTLWIYDFSSILITEDLHFLWGRKVAFTMSCILPNLLFINELCFFDSLMVLVFCSQKDLKTLASHM